MSDDKLADPDRREFLAGSIAAAGVTALVTMDAAGAQEAHIAARATGSGTVYTGETVLGKPVVSRLDVADLDPGTIHRLYFRGVQTAGGQHLYVSVVVAKGARPGRRFVLTSGVHGDEISSIRTVQAVMDRLDPSRMSGTVTAVLDISRPAVDSMQRRWPNTGRGIDLVDLNREWPGDENGATAAARHAGLLFNGLLKPNADLAIDFHTGTTGLEAAAMVLGDRAIPDVATMTDLFPVAQMWDNKTYPGVLHNAFVDAGIPCFTPEVGAGRILDTEMIELFVEGTTNVLKHYGVMEGAIGRTAADAGMFIAKGAAPILATEGGLVEFLVKLDERIAAGQTVAIQRNMFGETVVHYSAPVAGTLAAYRSDATAEPGNVLAFLLFEPPVAAVAAEERQYPE